jgi:hypothetical protein
MHGFLDGIRIGTNGGQMGSAVMSDAVHWFSFARTDVLRHVMIMTNFTGFDNLPK